MSAVPVSVPVQRHALGLPAGSVRALLAFGVLGLSWGIVLAYGDDRALPIVFLYLQALMLLILSSFFAAHGKSIGGTGISPSPLGLPRGSVRFLLLGGYAGLAFFLYHTNRDFDVPPKGAVWFVLLVLISGYFLGHLITRMVKGVSGGVEPFWFQDLQAWVALLAFIAMTAVAIVHLFINPSLKPTAQLDVDTLETFLAGVVGFYFGSRS